MIKVLMVSSEASPFAKTGGLGDVLGSLPKNLLRQGVDVRVIMPMYNSIPLQLKMGMKDIRTINIKLGWRNQPCDIKESIQGGVKFYFIGNEYYFGRGRLYCFNDEAERFAFFCKAVLETLPHIGFIPDIIHCNDWQTGMIPVLLKDRYQFIQSYKNIHTLFTIHNLQYQGVFPREVLGDILELGDQFFTFDKLEFFGDVSFIKGGLVFSDLISTVSPTYSYEIQYPYMGERLDGLLMTRNKDLYGILNGIDYDEYNPLTDPDIFANYDLNNLDAKAENKLGLQKLLGLDVSKDTPLIGIVSRLVSSKGLDLISRVFDELMDTEVQFAVVGTGEPKYESFFIEMAKRYKGKVSAKIMFDNELAHRIYAGADLFLMPSKFEPCGLGQIIALRYGAVPIVHETGGLMDTVQSYNEFTMEGNGFSFTDYNAQDMLYTIRRAINIYIEKDTWTNLVRKAMSCDYSWDKSATKYIELYNKLMVEKIGDNIIWI